MWSMCMRARTTIPRINLFGQCTIIERRFVTRVACKPQAPCRCEILTKTGKHCTRDSGKLLRALLIVSASWPIVIRNCRRVTHPSDAIRRRAGASEMFLIGVEWRRASASPRNVNSLPIRKHRRSVLLVNGGERHETSTSLRSREHSAWMTNMAIYTPRNIPRKHTRVQANLISVDKFTSDTT